MPHLYAYYRVAADDAVAAREEIAVLQACLAPYCGAAPRRMVRCEDAGMWMEVYENVADPQSFIDAMQNRLLEAGMDTLRHCERHLECFSDL